jgi:1-acyl-sn-glycerol-3-phosphate acyltransferase
LGLERACGRAAAERIVTGGAWEPDVAPDGHAQVEMRGAPRGASRHAERDFYYWRLFATGFCFVAFGIGGLVIGLLVAPLLSLCIRDRERLHRVVRRMVQLSFRVFVGLMKGVGVMTYTIHDRERLNAPGEIVIATHRTLIDVVFLVACIPNAVCVVKDGAYRNRAFGALVRSAGYINSAGGEHSLHCAVAALHGGATLVIFPEGTRTTGAAEPRLHRGAAYIAMAAGAALTPVRITCEPMTLTKADRWYEIPDRRMHFEISVGARIGVESTAAAASKNVAARALTARVKDFFVEDALNS